MTRCPDPSTLERLFQGSLAAAERAAVEAHIDGCPGCSATLAELARLFGSATWSGAAGPRPAGATVETVAATGHRAAAWTGSKDLGRYRLGRRLGAGGMGLVFEAEDLELHRRVALKILHTDAGTDPEQTRARLLREARAMARTNHPNVVAVYDVGRIAGSDGHDGASEQVFLAMELVEGSTLTTWLPGRARSEVLAAFVMAGRGLAAAHANGLVHRDFKPDNVCVGLDGRVRVMDFGLARMGGEEASARDRGDSPPDPTVTVAGTLLGTPAYMAPEQHLGLTAHAVADIYSYAVALYEAIHGERPFAGVTTEELGGLVLRGRPTHVPQAGRVPTWLHAVIVRGMALEPADRWPTMLAFAAALRRDPRARLRRLLVTGVAIVGVLGLAVVLPPAWHAAQVRSERERVEAQAEERLQAVLARERGDDAAAADAAFTTFVTAEEHRGTRALVHAWLRRGQSFWSKGQVDEGLDAMARAYSEASEPADIVAAMRAIAGVYHARWQLAELAPVLAVLAEHDAADDADILRMRVDVALARNDLGAALAATAAPAAATDLRALRPLLATLAAARPLGLRAESVVPVTTVDGPGFMLTSEVGTRLTLTDAAMRPRAVRSVPGGVLELVAGAPAYFAADRGVTTLFAWDGAEATPLWRCPDEGDLLPRTAAWLDLGTGGAFYFGAQWDWRGFYTLRPGRDGALTERPAHAGTAAGASDLGALLASDLDGDGRKELVVGTGAWNQLDLRVFTPTGDGLELADLRAPGRITGLAVVEGGGATRLAALKDDRYAPFATPPHTGEPAGVYLYTWRDGRLRDAGHLPLPRRGDAAALPIAEGLLACDLDGDRRSELIAGVTVGMGGSESQRRSRAAVFHQRSDGGFDRVILGMHALACAQLDDDPAEELVVRGLDGDPHAAWALGVGDVPIPTHREVTTAVGASPSADPLLADRWVRAGQLVASGLTHAAVRVLRDTAALTTDAEVEQTLVVRAAELLQDNDETRAAVAMYERGARHMALPGPVALRAAEAHVGLAEVAEADRRLRAVITDALVDDGTRAAAVARRQALAPMVASSLPLTFAAPMDPAWRLDPVALRRDPRQQSLHIDAVAGGADLASLPLVWEGGAVALAIDLTVEHLEVASALEFALVDAEGRTIVGVGVFAPSGFPRQQWLSCHDPSQPVSAKFAAVPTTTRARRRIQARAVWDPARGQVLCDAEVDEDAGRFVSRTTPVRAAAGAARLVIRASTDPLTHLAAEVHAITLLGVERPPGPVTTAGPEQRAARLLVEGRPAEALAELGERETEPMWRFLALDRMREPAAATAALRAHIQRNPAPTSRDDLVRLLRLQPDRVGPPLRDVLGPGVHAHVLTALYILLRYHARETWVHELILEEFPWRDDLDAVDDETRLYTWLMLGLALAATGRDEEARVATQGALAAAATLRLAPAGRSPLPAAPLLSSVWLHLATLLAADTPELAIAAAGEGIRVSLAPETTRMRLRGLADFDVLGAAPAWLDLVGTMN